MLVVYLVIGLCGSLFFVEYFGALAVKAALLGRLKKKTRGRLVLTFDDGPGQRLEARLLQILDRYGAKATFFINAQRAETCRQRLAVLAAAGHELGCHAYAHLNARRTWPWKTIADVKKAYRCLEDHVHAKACVRFPYGQLTTSLWLAAQLQGRKVVGWTIDSGDTYAVLPNPDEIVARAAMGNGGVVLMHSFDRDSGGEFREDYVLDVTEKLLAMAEMNGFRVCTCGELLKNEGAGRDAFLKRTAGSR